MANRHSPFGPLPTTPGPRRPDPAERRRHEGGAEFLLRLEDALTAAFADGWH